MDSTARPRRPARAASLPKGTTPPLAAAAAASSSGAISESAFADEAAERRLHILRCVAASGSISQAARDAGISYKAAWQAIHRLGEQAGCPVVAASVGGSGGGGARLTPAGERLLYAAELVQRAQRDAIAHVNAPHSAPATTAPTATSMRNHLPCTVQGLLSDSANDPLVRVALVLQEGRGELLADITRSSAEALALATGQRVLALCKAAAVRVVAAPPAPMPEGCATLPGEVQHIACGVRRDEVLLTVGSGALLAGFATRPHTLHTGGSAHALIDASCVAIALA